MGIVNLFGQGNDGEVRFPALVPGGTPGDIGTSAYLALANRDVVPGTRQFRAVRAVVTGSTGTTTGKWQVSNGARADVQQGLPTAGWTDDTTTPVSVGAGVQVAKDYPGVTGVRFVPDAGSTGTFVANFELVAV